MTTGGAEVCLLLAVSRTGIAASIAPEVQARWKNQDTKAAERKMPPRVHDNSFPDIFFANRM
jgi:hypothetical protein